MSDTPKLTFAKAYAELQAILQDSEKSMADLEKSIKAYKRAAELSQYLKKELKKMENQIEEISLDAPEAPPEQVSLEPSGSDDIPF